MATPDHYQSLKEGRHLISVLVLQVINPKTSSYLTQGLEIIPHIYKRCDKNILTIVLRQRVRFIVFTD